MFETRWRWNAQRSLMLERSRNGKKVPAALLRMRADDLLAGAFPAAAGLPGDIARRTRRSADGPPDRAADHRRLPHGGDGRGRLPRSARGAEGRAHRALRGRHRRALRVRARHPLRPALHLPRRRAPRRAAHPGRDGPARAGRAHRGHAGRARPGGHRARARRGLAAARERGRGARGAAVDGLRDGRRRASPGWSGWTRSPARAASSARATAGSRRRPRAIPRPSCEDGWKRWVRSSATIPLLVHLEAEGVVLRARIDGRPGLVRPAAARPHPPLHARPAAQGDRARHRRAVPALPRLLAARGPRAQARRAARGGRRRRAARRVRSLRAGLGRHHPPGARARATSASGWTSSRSPARSRGDGCGARAWPSPRRTPITLVLRQDLEQWADLAATITRPELPEEARAVHEALLTRGAMFAQELARATRLPAMSVEIALGALVALGRVDLRFLRRAALAARSRLAPPLREPQRRPLERPPSGAGGGGQSRRVRGAAAPEAHRRRLPQDAGPRAPARPLARRRARLPADGSARRDPRRALRGRLRRRAIRASGRGHRSSGRCGAAAWSRRRPVSPSAPATRWTSRSCPRRRRASSWTTARPPSSSPRPARPPSSSPRPESVLT